MKARTARAIALGAIATTAVAAPVATASAAQAEPRIIGLPLPDLGQVVSDLGATLGGIVEGVLPGTGAIVTETTGTVGGIITGTTQTVSDSVDETVGQILNGAGLGGVVGPDAPGGGAAGGLLPTNALNSLLQTLGIPTLQGTGTGQSVAPDGSITIDSRAPGVTFTVLSKLRDVKKDGRLRLQVASDEAGVIAFTSTLRPGVLAKTKAGTKKAARGSAVKHSRKVIHVPAVTLGFRQAGALKVTVRLSKTAQRNLGNAKDARISVGLLAADGARNQASERVKRVVKR
jgi:hypothetical protein